MFNAEVDGGAALVVGQQGAVERQQQVDGLGLVGQAGPVKGRTLSDKEDAHSTHETSLDQSGELTTRAKWFWRFGCFF